MEIDEYQNYQKAQGALNEALKCLSKAKTKNPGALEARAKFINQRLKLVKRFADARRLASWTPKQNIISPPTKKNCPKTLSFIILMLLFN